MEVTSKTNSIILRANRSGSQSETVYLGTKATRLGSDGDYQYKVEIIQYSKSSGGGFGPESPKVIGTRASGDPNKITWNDDAPDIVKKSWNNDKIVGTVKNQMRSMEDEFVQSSQNKENFRRDNGYRNYGSDSSEPSPREIPRRTPSKVLSRQDLRYPLDLNQSEQDVLKISIKERKPRRLQSGTQANRETGKDLAKIFLPINGSINDTLTVGYDSASMNAAEAFGAQLITQTLTNNQGQSASAITGGLTKDLIDGIGANQGAIESLIGSASASAAIRAFGGNTTTSQLLSRQAGVTLNPNMELLFRSPELRNFGFQYRFTPRSAAEGKVVKRIINFLKRSMVPKKGNGGSFFLTSPDVFVLEYMHYGRPHNSLNQFKTCVLRECRVQYAPEGTYATFPDGVMHSYLVTLGFSEIDPIFAEDYDETKEFGGFLLSQDIFEFANNSSEQIGF